MSKYVVKNIIIDSSFRNTNTYTLANDFVVYIGDTFKNVIALRLLKSELTEAINDTSYFVLNSVATPLQTQIGNSAYLYLNNYDNYMVTDGTTADNATNNVFFGRIIPGVDVYPAASGYPLDDPYTYMLNPPLAKLNRFHIKLLNADKSLYAFSNPQTAAKVILTIAVYCKNDQLPIREERHHNTIPIDFRNIQDEHTHRIPNTIQIQKEPHRRELTGSNRKRGDNKIPKEEEKKLNQWFDNFVIAQNKKEKRSIN
jgi:hypothetical protein